MADFTPKIRRREMRHRFQDDDAPATASVGTDARGTDASTQADVTAKLNVRARRDAADALRRSPGVMKLIKTGIFKFDDFLTNGALDMRKITAVRLYSHASEWN
jgi:hypothetical protein